MNETEFVSLFQVRTASAWMRLYSGLEDLEENGEHVFSEFLPSIEISSSEPLQASTIAGRTNTQHLAKPPQGTEEQVRFKNSTYGNESVAIQKGRNN